VGRPIAPRGASMLEVGKYGNEVAGAASGNCSDATASRQNLRPAFVVAGEYWICHRDIVNLENKPLLGWPPLKQRRMVPMSRFDPSRAARLCPAGPFLASACSLPAQTLAGASKEGKRSYGATTRTGLSAQPAGHLMMVPANASLNQ
jgi:hypothetical protein